MNYRTVFLFLLLGLVHVIHAQDEPEDTAYKMRCYWDFDNNNYNYLSAEKSPDGDWLVGMAKPSLFIIKDGLEPNSGETYKYVSIEASDKPGWYLREPHLETGTHLVTLDDIANPIYNNNTFAAESTFKMAESSERPGFWEFESLDYVNYHLYCNPNGTFSLESFVHPKVTPKEYYDRSAWELNQADSTEAAIVCDNDRVNITVYSWTLTDIVDTYLHVGIGDDRPECRLETEASGHRHIIFQLTECGAVTSMDDTSITYSYDVLTGTFNEGENGITRNKYLGIKLACIFDRTGTVQSSYTGEMLHASFETTYYGTLDFSMALYHDAALTDLVTQYQAVTLCKPIDVKISMHTAAYWSMFVTDCTARPNEGSYITYSLIKDGCFNEDDGTLEEIAVSDARHSYAFSFEVFKFKGTPVKTVYLTCRVIVCDEENPDIGCTKPRFCGAGGAPTATSPRPQKRNAPQSFELSHGPYIVMNGK